MSSVFPIIILPVFMLIVFLVQMIGAEINEESGYEVYRYDKTIDDAMEELKEKDNYDNYYLEFSYLDDYSLKVKLVTKEYIDIYDTQILNNALNNTKVSLSISHSNISIEELNMIY